MHITSDTKINDLSAAREFLLAFLVSISPKYKLQKNPTARTTVG